MTTRNKFRWLILIVAFATTRPVVAQEMIWTQPYSGNVVYGPLVSPDGEPLECPECQCEECQPGGCRGLIKKLFGSIGDKVECARHEYYHHKQMYHTNYTKPVMPPYCEIGYGYYETSWRRGPMTGIPCEPTAPYPADPEYPLEAPAPSPGHSSPPPFPQPPLEDPEAEPNLMDELEDDKKSNGANQVPGGPEGDKKPPYEGEVPETSDSRWKPTSPVSGQYY